MVPLYERNAEIESEFNVLITLMADMITAQAQAESNNTNAPAWSVDLHVLSMKLFKHLCSARALLEPCGVRTATLPPYSYIDHASVHAVIRSAIENYLVMHWLYADGNEEHRTFRHNIWVYGGWKKRSNFFASTEEAKIQKQKATEDAAALFPVIEASVLYQSCHPDRRKHIRQGNWQGGLSWKELAAEAGVHRTYFASIYPYLSGYAHSDFISCLQVGQAKDLSTQYDLASSSIRIGLMLLGHFAVYYSNLFPATLRVIDGSSAAKELVFQWSFKAEDMDSIYGNEE